MKIHAVHLQSFLAFAKVRGISPEEIMPRLNLSSGELSDPLATLEARDFYRLLEGLHERLQDEGLGWRAGEFLRLNALGLIYQISLQATTLEEAIYYLENFVHTTLPIIRLETQLGEAQHVIRLTAADVPIIPGRILLECILVIMARELQMMSTHAPAVRLYSPFATPAYPAYFRRGEDYRLEFTGLNLKAAIRSFPEARLHYLVPQYVKLIQGIKEEDSFQSRVKIAALSMAKPQLPKLEEIADTFHLTPRTLQRKLAGENLSFRGLTEGLKKQISTLLLRHQDYTIGDVGYLLGYSEPAAFVHSFKRWHGHSPSAFRKAIA